ncbi:MAG: DUF1134 domain-containing protein [Desulfovibrionales bacterium]
MRRVALILVMAFTVWGAGTSGYCADNDTYSQAEIRAEVEGFFEETTAGLADIIEKIFKERGRPNGFIKGGEGGGAIFVGLRYGEGTLQLKSGSTRKVYWQGPSVGFDLGGNASKVFTLIYNLNDPQEIFQRFPGVDGSAYVVGGFSMNYQQSNEIILAPIRTGVGLRLGANVGYLHYTQDKRYNPF